MESRKGRREVGEGMEQDGGMRKKDRQEKDRNRKGRKATICQACSWVRRGAEHFTYMISFDSYNLILVL